MLGFLGQTSFYGSVKYRRGKPLVLAGIIPNVNLTYTLSVEYILSYIQSKNYATHSTRK